MRRGGLRIAAVRLHLHAVDEVRELDRVLDEEHRDVVADEVPVAGVGVELDGEAAHVARRVDRAGAAGDGREAHEHRAAVALLLEDRGLRQLGNRLRDLRTRRARRSRARARCARECARGRSGRSSRAGRSLRAASGRAHRRAANSGCRRSDAPKLVGQRVGIGARTVFPRQGLVRFTAGARANPQRRLAGSRRTASRVLSCAGDCDLAFFSVVTTRTPDVLEIVGKRVRH